MTTAFETPHPARWALWPLAAAFGGATRVRSALYRGGVFRTERLDGTVISVGNLTVGGTGKTPMVLWLTEKLAAEGQRAAILTRGYGSSGRVDADGVLWSDEVALLRARLAGKAELGVGANRYASGKALAERDVRWFILDDGFQHLRLARDVDIVLLDAEDPFGGGNLLPAGRLREGPAALGRADLVVITRAKSAPELEATVRRFSRAPIFYAWAELEGVLPASDSEKTAAVLWQDAKVFAFSGIGNPTAFLGDLRRWNFRVTGERAFRDHHRYSQGDLRELERAAQAADAEALICTEKDLFNLPTGIEPVAPPALPIWVCRIRLELSDAARFWAAMLAAVERNVERNKRNGGKRNERA